MGSVISFYMSVVMFFFSFCFLYVMDYSTFLFLMLTSICFAQLSYEVSLPLDQSNPDPWHCLIAVMGIYFSILVFDFSKVGLVGLLIAVALISLASIQFRLLWKSRKVD